MQLKEKWLKNEGTSKKHKDAGVKEQNLEKF